MEQSRGSEGGFSFCCFKMTHELASYRAFHFHTRNYSAGGGVRLSKQRRDHQNAELSSVSMTALITADTQSVPLSSAQTERSPCLNVRVNRNPPTPSGAPPPPCVSCDREADLRRRRASSHPLPPSPRDRAARPVNTHTQTAERSNTDTHLTPGWWRRRGLRSRHASTSAWLHTHLLDRSADVSGCCPKVLRN